MTRYLTSSLFTAIVVLSAGHAVATVIGDTRFNCSYPSNLAPVGTGTSTIDQTCTVSLPKFDSSFGDLNSVTLTFNVNLGHSVALRNPTLETHTAQYIATLHWGGTAQ